MTNQPSTATPAAGFRPAPLRCTNCHGELSATMETEGYSYTSHEVVAGYECGSCDALWDRAGRPLDIGFTPGVWSTDRYADVMNRERAAGTAPERAITLSPRDGMDFDTAFFAAKEIFNVFDVDRVTFFHDRVAIHVEHDTVASEAFDAYSAHVANR